MGKNGHDPYSKFSLQAVKKFRKLHIPRGRNEQARFDERFYYEAGDPAAPLPVFALLRADDTVASVAPMWKSVSWIRYSVSFTSS